MGDDGDVCLTSAHTGFQCDELSGLHALRGGEQQVGESPVEQLQIPDHRHVLHRRQNRLHLAAAHQPPIHVQGDSQHLCQSQRARPKVCRLHVNPRQRQRIVHELFDPQQRFIVIGPHGMLLGLRRQIHEK